MNANRGVILAPSLRRFLKQNLPRCGPRQCGRTPCRPPAGGGWRGEHVDGVLPHTPPPAGPPPTWPPPAGGRSHPTARGGRQESRGGDAWRTFPGNHLRLHTMNIPQNWIAVTESQYAWERDALEFVRHQFPTHEPYRAWTNFEFVADDGSINEVDLLVCTPQGFFLIEIKSRAGRLFGDAGIWTWETDSQLITTDSPVIAANGKAKKLRSLLQRQKAWKRKGQLP